MQTSRTTLYARHRWLFSITALLAAALPAGAIGWDFSSLGPDDFNLPGNWVGGVVPGLGDAAEFLGSTGTQVHWNDTVGDTATASVLVDGAAVTFFTQNNLSAPAYTHTATGDTTVTGLGQLTLGSMGNGAMNLEVGGDLHLIEGGEVNMLLGSRVNASRLIMDTSDGQPIFVLIDGTSWLTLDGGTDLTIGDAAGGAATIDITRGARFDSGTGTTTINTTGRVNLGSDGRWFLSGPLEFIGGMVTLDGANTAITQFGSDPLNIGTALGATATLHLANGSLFASDTGELTVNATGDVNLESGATLYAANLRFAGQIHVNGADLIADHIQSTGGTLETDAASRILVNTISGFGDHVSFAGELGFGDTIGGPSSHTVAAGQSLEVGTRLIIGHRKLSTFTVAGEVHAGLLRLGLFSTAAGSVAEVVNAGTVVIDSYLWVDQSSILTVSGLDATVEIGSNLTLYAKSTLNLDAGHLIATTINHTHGGAFNFTAGTLAVQTFNGDLTNRGGTLRVGDTAIDDPFSLEIGTTTVSGGYTQQDGGTLAVELSSLFRGGTSGDADKLVVAGQLTFAGTLEVSFDAGFPLVPGARADILDWGSINGSFDAVVLNDPFGDLPMAGVGLNLQDLYTTGELRIELLGDLDTDGFVGIEDLDLLLANWGQSTFAYNYAAGDLTGDGLVNADDLAIVHSNWGSGVVPGDTIPEPSSAAIFILLTLIIRHRYRGAATVSACVLAAKP